MTSKVPFETWMMIAQCLPPAELQRLYTLSSAFFHAAMDARYQEVDLPESMHIARTLQRMEHLRQPHIACRVRYVKVSFQRHSMRYPANSSKSDQLQTALVGTLASLSAITKCDLVWSSSQWTHIVVSLWPFVTSNLRILELVSSIRNIHSLLQSTSIHFSNLESVHMVFSPNPYPGAATDEEISSDAIAAFLNKHHSNLLSLTILWVVEDGFHSVEVSPLLHRLGHFPQLQHLGLCFGWFSIRVQMLNPEDFARFLSRHANTLQSISIQCLRLSRPPANTHHLLEPRDISQSLFNIPFPCMLKLEIFDHPPFLLSNSRDVYLEITPRFSDTLTTLTLNPCPAFSYGQVNTIISFFSYRSAHTRLKNLFLAVAILTPELVDLLASGFPGLVWLTLEVCDLMWEGSYFSSHPVSIFKTEMRERVNDEWALCHLAVEPRFFFGDFPSVAGIIKDRISNIHRMRSG